MNDFAQDIADAEQITLKEAIQLGAVDSTFFGRHFFPRTLRQETPNFHRRIDTLLDSSSRLVSIKAFRGSAKTTKTRIYTCKRVAYGLARTVIFVSKSEGHAIHSVKWIRKQIEHNRKFAEAFQLSAGDTWSDTHIEIKHGVEGHVVHILPFGIGGSVRGVNLDDYRPDLIVLDDPLDEENTATPLQREKTEGLIYGALKESLAPVTEAPDAKMVMLQTPQNLEDISMKSETDPEWVSGTFPCWTPETMDLPTELQESSWEDRFPTEVLRQEKTHAIQRNQLSIFVREKECRITSKETRAFNLGWLQFYDQAPDGLYITMAIDPVPPPSKLEIEKGLKQKDFEAFSIVGKKGADRFLLEYQQFHGHDPSWTVKTFFELVYRWRPVNCTVESIAYQRVLAWILRQAMERQKKWVPILEYADKRSKYNRILDAYSGIASNGHFYVKREHTEFIAQFQEYPAVKHDDLLDSVAMALSSAAGGWDGDGDTIAEILAAEKDSLPKLDYKRGAP